MSKAANQWVQGVVSFFVNLQERDSGTSRRQGQEDVGSDIPQSEYLDRGWTTTPHWPSLASLAARLRRALAMKNPQRFEETNFLRAAIRIIVAGSDY
jgi:hypothetical protein